MDFHSCIGILASLAFIQVVRANQVYIDPIRGIDDVNCGHLSKPCKKLRFAWNKSLISSTNATSNVTFVLYPGVYNTDQKHEQPLFYRCNDEVKEIEIKEIENRTSLPVDIFYSFEISSCKFKLTGLTLRKGANLTASDANIQINRCLFKSEDASLNVVRTDILFDDVTFSDLTSTNQILVLRSDRVIINNSVFKNITLNDLKKPFIDMQSVGMLSLENVTISQNSGPQYKVGLEAANLLNINLAQNIYMKNITFQKNNNLDFHIMRTSLLIFHQLIVDENVNSTLSFKNVNGSVTRALLQNRFTDEDRPTVLLKQSSIHFKDVVVSCIGRKRLSQSPISVDTTDTVKCTNCSISNCKDICGAGFQTIKGVFCEKCPVGTSAHAWEKLCRRCHPGHYSPKPGATDCQECEKGTFCKKRGCAYCKQCKNEMFTSTPGSVSCSQMSLLFIVLLGVALLLIMTPIAVKVIKTKRVESDDDDNNGEELEDEKNSYKKFENENIN